MDRPKKSRSLGTDPIPPTKQPTSSTTSHAHSTKRSDTGERHYSAPSASRRRQSDAQRTAESSKTSDKAPRSSKASSRDASLSRPVTSEFQLSERRRTSSFSAKSSTKSSETEVLLTFAVIGNPSVGKSAFIRNALEVKNPNSTPITTSKVSLNGVLYRLQILETHRDSLNFVQGKIIWPSVPNIGGDPDGALCLYDVSNKESLEGLPELLAALDATGIATCLVSCKVDIPLCDHQIPSSFLDKVQSRFPDIATEEASIDSPDSAKRALLRVFKKALAEEGTRSQLLRDQEESPRIVFPLRTSSRNPSDVSLRSRANPRHPPMPSKSMENLSSQQLQQQPIEFETEDNSDASSIDEEDTRANSPPKTPLRVNTTDAHRSQRITHPQTPISTSTGPGTRLASPAKRHAAPDTPESFVGPSIARRESSDTVDSRIYRTFLNMDDESIHEDLNPVDDTSEKLQKLTATSDALSDGVTFSELVDRLLAMPSKKGDQKFVPAFLCLYRAFATPIRLLGAIMERFVKTEKSDLVAFTKTAELLRYLSILGMWTTYYPGDFADSTVRDTATQFISTLEKSKNYAAAARQVSNNLQTTVSDEDEDWAFSDVPKSGRSRSNTTSQKLSSVTAPLKDRKSQTKLVPKSNEDEASDVDEGGPAASSPRHSGTASSASSLVRASQISSQTLDNLHNLETARENARKLRTIPHNPISKVQWQQFMSCSTEELAIEITRMDWAMYSSIRPRDFVRFVTVPTSQRAKAGQVDYIAMMTKHFNHLALFVSGMILLRDKPKHRAKMLERFMELAWKVRQMNNYHALGAIVAALNSEEIVRLSQTQELISPDRHKQFLRLKILMGHQKAHAAYRMAWENSSGERIPFLPRIQEDLMKSATANATFVGGKIKWSKFEVMGETIVGVQRSQEQPYALPDRTARGQDIARLILETKVLEGDENCVDPQQELYERSKQVEPLAAGAERKKFDWLRR